MHFRTATCLATGSKGQRAKKDKTVNEDQPLRTTPQQSRGMWISSLATEGLASLLGVNRREESIQGGCCALGLFTGTRMQSHPTLSYPLPTHREEGGGIQIQSSISFSDLLPGPPVSQNQWGQEFVGAGHSLRIRMMRSNVIAGDILISHKKAGWGLGAL